MYHLVLIPYFFGGMTHIDVELLLFLKQNASRARLGLAFILSSVLYNDAPQIFTSSLINRQHSFKTRDV